jgi:hypothetical protein
VGELRVHVEPGQFTALAKILPEQHGNAGALAVDAGHASLDIFPSPQVVEFVAPPA